ncbi:hypothetical protein [Acrocarpospora sp. B8E8]|uniref:hypothetical protein n=1 Tax=Acrocarpospora sp. B8E8 TaxID=3153572 RepID=UPI00325F6494
MDASPNLSLAVQSVTGQHNPRSFVSPSGVVYELIHVTPEMAMEWLGLNTGNRPLRAEMVDRLGRDMIAALFLENGDAIRFSASKVLLDGQHRLHALAASGVAAWLLVVSNLPDQARDTVDDGAKRTMGDRLSFHGETDASILASVIRRAQLWSKGVRATNGRFQPSAMEAFHFLADNPDIRMAATAASHYRRVKLLRPSTIGLTWWLFAKLDGEQCKEFFDRLTDGDSLAKKHPILTLRNRLIEARAAKTTLPENLATAFVVKAWNRYREGGEMVVVRWAENERFPEPK